MKKCARVSNKNNEDYKILRNKISYNIKKNRKNMKITQEKLAETAGISNDFMRRIESTKGTCGLSVYTLFRIAVALNVSVDELMEFKIEEDTRENIDV